jgi:hypothetical protein
MLVCVLEALEGKTKARIFETTSNKELPTMMIVTPQNNPAKPGPTSFMTERNAHEVRCGMCRREFYVDEETYRSASEAIESGLDDPYRCEVCAEEYDDLAYEG